MAESAVQVTTNLAFAGSGTLDLALYVQQCWKVEDFVVPSTELIGFGLLALAPLVHLIYRGIMRRLTHWADGGPEQPEVTK